MKAFILMHKRNCYNMGQNRANELLEINQWSHDLFNSALHEWGTPKLLDRLNYESKVKTTEE